YARSSLRGRLPSIAQGEEGARPVYVAHTNENSMAEAMKFMALEGHGIAWLPRGLVGRDIAEGTLASVAPAMPMEGRLYRNAERSRSFAEQVWTAASQLAEGYAQTE